MTTTIHITPPPLSSQAMNDLLYTIVLMCRGKDKFQRDFWAYMCIKPSMAESFKIARDKGDINLSEYGTIIEAGEGTDAPQEVKERMTREYGVRHDYEEQLSRAIAAVKRNQNY